MKLQKITSCVTHATEAHLTDQTDQRSPRHQPFDIRTHQAVYQRRTVARGGEVGPAELAMLPVQMHFGGKIDLIL